VRSPTTTGKVERLYQTIQHELLNDHEPFLPTSLRLNKRRINGLSLRGL
jgi:hypothetical protein